MKMRIINDKAGFMENIQQLLSYKFKSDRYLKNCSPHKRLQEDLDDCFL